MGTIFLSFKEQFGKMREEGHRFSTVRMEDADWVKVLEPNGIQYTAQLENTWFKTLLSCIVPMLIFFVLKFRRVITGESCLRWVISLLIFCF